MAKGLLVPSLGALTPVLRICSWCVSEDQTGSSCTQSMCPSIELSQGSQTRVLSTHLHNHVEESGMGWGLFPKSHLQANLGAENSGGQEWTLAIGQRCPEAPGAKERVKQKWLWLETCQPTGCKAESMWPCTEKRVAVPESSAFIVSEYEDMRLRRPLSQEFSISRFHSLCWTQGSCDFMPLTTGPSSDVDHHTWVLEKAWKLFE